MWAQMQSDPTPALFGIGAIATSFGAYALLPSTRIRRKWKRLAEASGLEYRGRSIDGKEVKRTPTVRRYRRTNYGFDLHLRLPIGAKPADIEDRADQIAWGLDALRVTPEVVRPSRMIVRVYKRDPLIDLRQASPLVPREQTGVIEMAVTEAGNPLTLDLDQTPHILIGGTTGAGKSNAVNILIERLRASGADVVCIDLGEVDMAFWAEAGMQVETEFEQSVEVLEALVTEMRDRVRTVRLHGVTRMADVAVAARSVRKVVVVDEAQLILHPGRDKDSRELAARAELALFHLLSKSRKAGMSVVIATQRPGTDVIPSRLRDLCSVRIALRTETRDATDMILGSGSASLGAEPHRFPANLPGVAIVRVDGSEFTRARFPQFRADSFGEPAR